MTEDRLNRIAPVQQRIVMLLKQRGPATTAEIAERFDVSYEAVRQQVKQLEALGLVERTERPNPQGVGRPLGHYSLSTAGDHLFPKNYDQLTIELIDAIGESLGEEALREVLAELTDRQVAAWRPKLEGLDLDGRLRELQALYVKDDPFSDVASSHGDPALVERNCPYRNVAERRPAVCSVTISTLARLLGFPVTREERFQDGDGRCTFRVHVNESPVPQPDRFTLESD